MNLPNVKSSILDAPNKVRYDIYAYRSLTEAEMNTTVHMHLASLPKRKRPKKNSVIKIVTSIGSDA